jgi:hypothetical protein
MTRLDSGGRNISAAVRLSASSQATSEVGCINGNRIGDTGKLANFEAVPVWVASGPNPRLLTRFRCGSTDNIWCDHIASAS